MPPESPAQHASYFETPARAERLQLVRHLVSNTDEAIYLRGPAGAGKTHFARRLLDSLRDDAAVVWLDAAAEDIPGRVVHDLGLPPAAAAQWPHGVLAAVGGRPVVLVVDNAHRLVADAIGELNALHGAGGRLLLLGQGDVGDALDDLAPRFVDLPPFDPAESAAFLRRGAGRQAERVADAQARRAHAVSGGLPGPLLDALSDILSSPSPERAHPAATSPRPASGRAIWRWLGLGVGLVLLVVVLVFQDAINAVLDPPDPDGGVATARVEPDTPAPDPPTSAPTQEVVPPMVESRHAPAVELPELVAPVASIERAPGQATTAESEALDAVTPAQTGAGEPAARQSEASSDAVPDTAPPVASAAEHEPLVAVGDAQSPASSPGASRADDPVVSDSAPSDTAAPDVAVRPPHETAQAVPVDGPPRAAEPAAPKAKPSPVDPVVSPSYGSAWLASRVPHRYTLQLVGGRERRSLEQFILRNRIAPPYAIFERRLDGRPWYSLVAGDYDDRDAAVAARARLPRQLRDAGVWPRTFESINKSR